VGYLHHTVKDFIQLSDVWKKLLSATKPTFDPDMHLSISRIAYLIRTIVKGESMWADCDKSNTSSPVLTLSSFWFVVIDCIDRIRIYRPPEMQVQLFEEIKCAVEGIIVRYAASSNLVTYGDC